MNKLVAISLLASLLVPSSAMALEEGTEFEVFVDYDPAGTLVPYLFKDVGPHCLYSAEWYNQIYAASEQCDILEKKTRAHLSCRDNKYINFPTSLINGAYCNGWNLMGYPVEVEYMNLGENYSGFTGAVKFAGWYAFSSIEAWEV